MHVLLMTGTIAPMCNIAYNDVLVRYKEYMKNIERYIKESNFQVIVFAENSGYSFDIKYFEKMAERYNKQFEYLDLSASANTNGNMSVGDALLILEGIKRSKLIKQSQCIWKVSGRCFIRNINDILEKTHESERNVFLYSPVYNAIETYFFKCGVNELEKIFLTNENIKKMENSCIEYVFKNVWDNNKDIKIDTFAFYPDTEGVRSSGQKYTLSRCKYIMKTIFLKLGRYSVK